MTSWFDLFSEVNLFPFFFNIIEPPVCSIVSNYIQPVECQMSLPHKLTGVPQEMHWRHNSMIIMIMEKLGTRVSNTCPIPLQDPTVVRLITARILRTWEYIAPRCSRKALEPLPLCSSLDFPCLQPREKPWKASLTESESWISRRVTAGPWVWVCRMGIQGAATSPQVPCLHLAATNQPQP